MTVYFAFLRGINVSGQKLIKMTELEKIFTDAKFSNVKTFIQSGNVAFDSPETDAEIVEMKLEHALTKSLGYHVDLFLRTSEEIMQMIDKQPFHGFDENADLKKYVTFARHLIPVSVKLPLLSPAGDVELIMISGNTIFSLAHPAKDGQYGFPNGFIEKKLGISATTRNWNTVCKILSKR
jgi:uncharacterized protein (DUF1697 family)